MSGDFVQLAGAAVSMLAPFLPFILKVGEAGANKLGELVAEKGGEATWKKAESLWAKISGHGKGDPGLQGLAAAVAAIPNDKDLQTKLASTLANYLQLHPDLAQDLEDLLGGDNAVQEILAGQRAWVEEVQQEMAGAGIQRVQVGDDSVITGFTQRQGPKAK